MGRTWRVVLGVAAMLAATPATAAAQRLDVTQPPSVSGAAQVGVALEAVGAMWTGRPPITATYFWLRCDGDSLWRCRPVEGAEGPSYVVSAADLGIRLRVAVMVENHDGRDFAWSQPTAAVVAAPPPPPPPITVPPPPDIVPPAPIASPPPPVPQPRLMRPAPLVRIAGWLTPRGAMVTRLTVSAPRGAAIAVRCFGRSCPRETLARATKVTRLRVFERRLRAGTRLVIRVTRNGFIGKHTVIRIRRDKPPARRDRCLFPDSDALAKCPAA